MKLVDMKKPKKTKKEMKEEMEIGPMEEENYPWGLKINLEKESLDKLGIMKKIKAGEMVDIKAKGKVIEVRTTDTAGKNKNDRENVEIQIQKLAITNKKHEEQDAEEAFEEGAKED